SKRVVDFIELEGVIDPVTSRYLLRQIDRSEERGSHAIVVRLDTPGGLDVSMREMVQRILAAEVPVVVWIAPSGARAASAGVFITYASHVAVMAPGTNIGAAHPVNLGGELDEESARKATNDAAGFIRSIAEQRGRNVEWAEESVRESASITSDEAEELGVIDYQAGAADLYDRLDGHRLVLEGGRTVTLDTDNVQVRFHKMGLLERILHTAIRPEVAYLLLLLGFYGLIFELYHPGIGAAGVLGGVSLILGFYALSVLPTSWAGVALMVLGVAFFLVDLHTAGLGVFTVGGTAALVAGSLLLFSGADPEFRLGLWAIGGATLGSLLFFIGAMTAAIRARLSKPVSGAEGMIGITGVARTDIAPEGRVSARGTLWRARTAGAAISQGSAVRVTSVSGLMLTVEPVVETADASAD
ncbi:MAG: NfeD family protein, partial [Actinomycetota bacterium]